MRVEIFSFCTLLLLFNLLELSFQQCVNGENNCATCYNQSRCHTCSNGFGLTNDKKCLPCSRENCVRCPNDYKECTQCSNRTGAFDGRCIPCTNGCIQCPLDPQQCTLCGPGYREWGNGRCQSCNGSCLKCPDSRFECQLCQDGFGLEDQRCYRCNSNNCRLCQNNYLICEQCEDKYTVGLSGQCLYCNFSNCLKCNLTLQVCTKCENRYSLQDGLCQRCSDNRCSTCPDDQNICTSCQPGSGVDENYTCSACQDSLCTNCSTNFQICTVCQPGYGPNNHGQCVECAQDICQRCGTNFMRCANCTQGFGPSNGTCIPCSKSNCLLCTTSASQCRKCVPGFSLSNKNCIPCEGNCLQCQNGDPSSCTNCPMGYYLNLNRCYTCPSICLDCSYNLGFPTDCHLCIDGMYSNQFLECQPCPITCLTCQLYQPENQVSCNTCIDNFSQTQQLPKKCLQPCGDFISIYSQCDNGINIPWTGCSNLCTEQQNFTCFVSSQTLMSTCSYDLPIQFVVKDIVLKQFQNAFTVIVEVWPPLYAFTQISSLQSELTPTIASIWTTSSSYRAPHLHIHMSFNESISQDVTVLFPSGSTSTPLYFSTTPVGQFEFKKQLIYYHPNSLMVSRVLYYLSYILLALGWINAAMSFVLNRLSGLEAMITLQLFFISIIGLPTSLHLPFYILHPLRYVMGLNLNFSLMADSSAIKPSPVLERLSMQRPHTEVLGIGTKIEDIYNVGLVIQLGFFLLQAVFKIVTLVLKKKYEKTRQYSDQLAALQKIRLLKYQRILEFFTKNFMFWNALQLPSFCLALYCHITSNSPWTPLSLSILSLSCVCYMTNLMIYMWCPDPLGHFRYSFKTSPSIYLSYFILYMLSVAAQTVLLLVLPLEYCYLSVIPFGIFALTTLILKPSKLSLQNNLSIYFSFTLLCVLALQVYLGVHQRGSWSMGHIGWGVAIGGVLVMLLVGIGDSIYWFITLMKHKPQDLKELKQKVLLEFSLDTYKLTDKMYQLGDRPSIYKNIVPKNSSILDFTASLQYDDIGQQRMVSHRALVKETKRKNKVHGLKEHNQGKVPQTGRGLDGVQDYDKLRFQVNEGWGQQSQPNQLEFSNESQIILSPEQISKVINVSNYKDFLQENQPGQLTNLSGLPKESQDLLQKVAFAYQLSKQEEDFIRFTNAARYTGQGIKGGDAKNIDDYHRAYTHIHAQGAQGTQGNQGDQGIQEEGNGQGDQAVFLEVAQGGGGPEGVNEKDLRGGTL